MDIDHTLTGRRRGGGRHVVSQRRRAGPEACAAHSAQTEIRSDVNLVLQEKT